jgi:hypothetical protein
MLLPLNSRQCLYNRLELVMDCDVGGACIAAVTDESYNGCTPIFHTGKNQTGAQAEHHSRHFCDAVRSCDHAQDFAVVCVPPCGLRRSTKGVATSRPLMEKQQRCVTRRHGVWEAVVLLHLLLSAQVLSAALNPAGWHAWRMFCAIQVRLRTRCRRCWKGVFQQLPHRSSLMTCAAVDGGAAGAWLFLC